ncbi:hypothetical protein CQW49_22575 (plasmid) [Methylosinus trichosporium OB3b]|uniref:Uncharacterized protein n=1 Tax=Methylosinus trichosporium (strain ATCC 35070 / NCIMB 11131 / UNIQEM 75 / OB3b) TaxID=595536 RepID=A0A2D2D6Y1_METT3|nr:hypothetical protein [Methylosinus trichosporium]ATQ70771.1 hypothetical protein CQW49_22575 [Methylosinus trichosporium OB3b]
MKSKFITEHDLATLANICRVATERFKDHEAEFRTLAAAPPSPASKSLLPTGDAALRLADQFALQASEAYAFVSLFEGGEPFTMRHAGADAEA